MHQAIFRVLRHHLKPLTFAEIMGPPPEHGCGFHPQYIRSLRRALRKMVDDGDVLAIGAGGPRDPHRYCIDPLIMAMATDKAEFDTLMASLSGTP